MKKYLVIVESPAKCKTINKFLGKDYQLMASFGHVRDLPGKSMGIDIEKNFEPSYVTMKDKSKVLKDIKQAAQKSELVYLATDPDREGEAIAWHIAQATKLPDTKIKRIVFNEITESAIKHAITSSRNIDINLVYAQQARRVLDRLIGYTLSPLLSKKIQRGLSAGRVQSVAVKIICKREKEINDFIPKEYWVIETDLNTPKKELFTAKLVAKQSLKEKFEVSNETDANTVTDHLESSQFSIDDIIKKRIKRNPPVPFITSTLQQEASRKLNWSAKKTMMMAQKLYEGVDIKGDSVGLITYMRTDSIRLSDSSILAAKDYIKAIYSDAYLGIKAKSKKKKSNIQDAHEAIRPVSIEYPPDKIKSYLSTDHFKLYKLIWDRFIASQMKAAEYDRTQIVICAAGKETYFLRATGSVLFFDGFTRVYSEGSDEKKDDNQEKTLPLLQKQDALTLDKVHSEQKFTQPPPRYTEASLVKELEELGIGRPSTYAPTLSTIQDRGYVTKDQKKLIPSELGMTTNDHLESFFKTILDLKFTANMETQLDDIQDGKHQWNDVVSDYYKPLGDMMEVANKDMQKISLGERNLGKDPKTQKDVLVKIGRYGPMVQLGLAEDDDKPLFASISDEYDIKTITLAQALSLLAYPKVIGTFENHDIIINRGKYGPYVKLDKSFVSIPDTLSLETITQDDAIVLIQEKRKHDQQRVIHSFTDVEPPIDVLNGRYGPYIKCGKKNYKIPKNQDPNQLTVNDCIELIKKQKKKK
ncbi:type I DNA topoisomerase [Candidatus Marinamargulisbacteria bacterium SCGC AG-333-B06]|nr:type I DNA topoisomerase [Candidatus Marinamargulisbacteria bacterium SCGC AG-333-B06]